MLNMPVSDIKRKIHEQAGMALSEIDTKVAEKMKQLSGLISEEGALHIIANELSVQLVPKAEERKVTDLVAGMKDVNQNVKVIQVYELREFQTKNGGTGKVASFLAGDETGVTRVTAWGDKAEKVTPLAKGDVVRVEHGYVKENNGRNELHVGDRGEIVQNPAGVSIEVTTKQGEYVRKKINELSRGDYRVELLGTVVQVYDPRHFTRKDGQEGVVCNMLIDDGSGTMRVSCWGGVAAEVLGMKEAELMERKEGSFEEEKVNALGSIVKVQGRAKLNTVYNNIEVSVDVLDMNPEPQEELTEKLAGEVAQEKPVSLDDIDDVDLSGI